ncbi:MAG: nucleoside triphosphate pyrophosphohydrolase [Kofleriaceae bacterium]|nr:nucleoside triphosphate pyrophosphohydrolase [Kofleriaceae bacterium]
MVKPPPPPPAGAPAGASLSRLVAVMDTLLAPDGCPWDREQTLASLRPFLLEETYEVLDALERDDAADHCEELGDVLMQVVFQAALRRAEGAFDVDTVVAGICDKLIRRHPHIFDVGDGTTEGIDSAAKVLTQWHEIKAAEKAARAARDGEAPRTLAGVARGQPALARAQQLGGKAGKVGFDWPGHEGSLGKVREEVDEIAEAIGRGDRADIHHEIGDLLFAVVNLARKVDVDAEIALHDASARFTSRFEFIEDRLGERGRSPRESNLDEMDALWNDAKRATGARKT